MVSRMLRNPDGTPQLNKFGENQYATPESIPCRMERGEKYVETANGAIVRSTTRYFLDAQAPIEIGDLINNAPVIVVKDFINAQGASEGTESYVS